MSEPMRQGIVTTLVLARRLAVAALGATALVRQYAIGQLVRAAHRVYASGGDR